MNTSPENKAVVTGGAGFIGSHLAEALVRRGYFVAIVDDLSTGNMQNIQELLETGKAEFHKGSITDTDLLNSVFKGARYVFHLAAMASVPLSLKEPLTCHDVNATGTLKVLSAAKDNGVSKLVLVSSCAVYGDTEIVPTPEETPVNPLSPYAVAKLAGEQYCRIFNRLLELPAVSLRFFNIYGPRQSPDSPYAAAIPVFIRCISEGKNPVIFDDGEQTRDFIFVSDAVSACILAAETDISGEYNIGSGTSVSVNELIRLLIRIMGKDVVAKYTAPRPGDIKFSSPDITRISGIGYKGEVSLEEGLRRTIDSLVRNQVN